MLKQKLLERKGKNMKYKVFYSEDLKGEVEANNRTEAIRKFCNKKGLDVDIAPIDDFQVMPQSHK